MAKGYYREVRKPKVTKLQQGIMHAQRAQRVAREFEDAFKAARGMDGQVEISGAHIKIGHKRFTLEEVELTTAALWAEVHQRELTTPEDSQ